MLYLPPPFAHDGVARRRVHDLLDRLSRARRQRTRAGVPRSPCATSVDARRPLRRSGPRRPHEPGAHRRGDAAAASRAMLREIRWNRATTSRASSARFCPSRSRDVVFDPPQRRAVARAFAQAIARRGVALDRRTQLLYDDDRDLHQRRGARRGPRRRAHVWPRLANARSAARARRRVALGRRARDSSTTDTAMDSSTSPETAARRAPPRSALDTVAAQTAAIDELIGLAQHKLQVFDIDLSQTGWNTAARAIESGRVPARARPPRASTSSSTTRAGSRRPARASSISLRRYLDRDHGLPDRRGSARRDGPAGDRRRPALPASLPHRPAARVAGHRATRSWPMPLVTRFEEIWATGRAGRGRHGARALSRLHCNLRGTSSATPLNSMVFVLIASRSPRLSVQCCSIWSDPPA